MYRSSAIPRGYIKFMQYLGTFFSALILIVTIWLLLSPDFIQVSNDTEWVWFGVLIGVEVYMLWKSIYSAFVIINYMNKATDEEIIANRFIMAVLSLGVGGFVTPFILTRIPNMNSQSTINPRAFLCKHLGFTMIVGFILFMTSVLITALSKTELNFNQLINTNNEAGQIGFTVLVLSIVGCLIGILGFGMFHNNNASEQMKEKNARGLLMQIVGVIFAIIATVEMILLAIMAVIRMVSVITNSLQRAMNSEGIFKMLAFFMLFANISIQFLYVSMIMSMCGRIISGLWAKDQVITIKHFDKVAEAEMKQNKATL